jgi:hypothetical protein
MNKYFLIVMSRGPDIPIDSEELPKVIQALQTKQPAIMKRGMFNPSFWISTVEDIDRREGWNRELGQDKREITSKKPLSDLFLEMRSNLQKMITT